MRDTWVAQSVKHLPSAQVMISESWDRAPHGAPYPAGVCFSLSLCLPPPHLCSLSLLTHGIILKLMFLGKTGSFGSCFRFVAFFFLKWLLSLKQQTIQENNTD